MTYKKESGLSRRKFIRNAAMSSAILASLPMLGCRTIGHGLCRNGPVRRTFSLDDGWLFGGKFSAEALVPSYDDTAYSRICLPHCVSKLSWQNWDPTSWEDVWIYRRHFELPSDWRSQRVFLRFDGVMAGATPAINGHALPQHFGGYLPFEYEITDWLTECNVLAVAVDSRWNNVPPEGSPRGPSSIDYLEPGGIFRSVRLEAVPLTYIKDVFAKPVNVLDANRKVEVACTIDSVRVHPQPLRIQVTLLDGGRVIANTEEVFQAEKSGQMQITLSLSDLGNIALWDVDSPRLYNVKVALFEAGRAVHEYHARIGFREARFEVDGFFLNGRRLRLFGLDRHELFPYVGFAMPSRVMRHDANMIRHEFNCNAVRCSHYPQSEAFLNACDELGLMVWEEVPGWQYIGDTAWRDLALRDVENMIRRDRNHPAVIIWGTRINESHNDPALYEPMMKLAKSLDGSRPTSGSMTSQKARMEGWQEDVFAFDDYHAAADGSVGIDPPLSDVPYMLTETVGQFSYGKGKRGFTNKYRRAGDLVLQMEQALFHAQAHNKAAAFSRCAGVIAWCAFDYGSLMNAYNAVKCPGVADVFRIPKLGATFYQSQVDPKIRAVIAPNFYWDFGPQSPNGPGKNVAIFSNCDRLELFIDHKKYASLQSDASNFPNLKYPPFIANLELDGAKCPELRIDGYIGKSMVLSRSFSSNPAVDQFFAHIDDHEIFGNGTDATRLLFGVVDRFGSVRPFGQGQVTFRVEGPGVVVGDNPFLLEEAGNMGAIWIKAMPHSHGVVKVTASHATFGERSAKVRVRSASAGL